MKEKEKAKQNEKKSTAELGEKIKNELNVTLSFAKLSRVDAAAEAFESIRQQHTMGYGENDKPCDLAGQMLKGKYKILSLLGEGGGSNVYLCERILVADRVALKMLFAHLASDPIKA